MNGDCILLRGFQEPQNDYRPAAMWFINDILQEDEITLQLESFKANGINDIFFSPNPGLLDDYLGARYFEAVKYTVAECKRLGLSFWLYDEYEYPSGTAGGQLLRDQPQLRAKMLSDKKEWLAPGMSVKRLHVKGQFEGAYLVDQNFPENMAMDVSADVTVEPCDDGFYFSYTNLRGSACLLHIMSSRMQDCILAAAFGARSSIFQEGYIDALREEGIRAFIDCTHEKYKEAVGEEFGKTVRGLFTDEVCVGAPFALSKGNVPWNDQMRQRFFDRYGYDLSPWLYALVETPVTPREKQVRYHLIHFK